MSGSTEQVVSRDSAEWQRAKERALKRDQYRCQACTANPTKTSGVDLQVHHIRPVEKGGTHDLENLVTLCNSCHWDLHKHHDDKTELSPDLLEDDDRATYGFPETRSPFDELREIEVEIIQLLKDRGPTQLKEIIEETGYSRGYVQKNLELLQVGGYVCRASRGVYAYIPETEYREFLTRENDETGRRSVSVWDPGQQVTLEEAIDDA